MGTRIQSWLWLVQRVTAMLLMIGIGVHFTTNIMAVQDGLSAREIIGRTSGNIGFLAFYMAFSVVIALHGAIGLRTVLREWTPLPRPVIGGLCLALAILLAAAGSWAAFGLYVAQP